MLSNVPGTNTTGYGCSAEGLQDQSLAPGGEMSTAWAGAAINEEARTAAAATDRARLSNDMETSLFVCLGKGPELMVLGCPSVPAVVFHAGSALVHPQRKCTDVRPKSG